MKSGFIAIIGRPNAGKSTILNKLTGQKIAAISSKPQTTRTKILGIVTTKESQSVFVDTPGIHFPRNKLGDFMNKEAKDAVKSVDMIVLVVDESAKEGENDRIIESLKNENIPVILAINKIDLFEKEKLFSLIQSYSQKFDFDAVIPISAINGDGINILREEIDNRLEEGPMYFSPDMITAQPERQIVAELIREKALWCLSKEVPHGIAVEIESYKEKENGTVQIGAVIYCEKSSHKGIIIGKGGAMLKNIGQKARIEIEKFLDTKVFLELWVKVKEDWRNSDILIKNFGYKSE